jgi:hypothetical protein
MYGRNRFMKSTMQQQNHVQRRKAIKVFHVEGVKSGCVIIYMDTVC